MLYKQNFQGKTCIVTGGASGIGFALCKALLEAKAIVVMADRDKVKLQSSINELQTIDPHIYSMEIDVTDSKMVQQAVDKVVEQYGHLDFIFNNAGISGTMPIEQATLEHWQHIVDINIWGVINGVHAALPVMLKQGSGHIINTASAAGIMPFPFQALYCTSKFAVVGLSESLRLELSELGIHISVICPGNVKSAIFSKDALGNYRETAPPEDAIEASEAADIILKGITDKKGIIAFPETVEIFWDAYRTKPEAFEKKLLEMAQERRLAYSTKGTYY